MVMFDGGVVGRSEVEPDRDLNLPKDLRSREIATISSQKESLKCIRKESSVSVL